MTSLADRITKPENGQDNGNAPKEPSGSTNTTASQQIPTESGGSSSSWADETTSAADAVPAAPAVQKEAEKDMSSVSGAQTDGAGESMGGENGVIEPSYDVDVKLSDMQANPDDPLYSIKSFEQLGL